MIVINKNGFTLIELIAVIGIVAVTAVILGTNFMKLIGNVSNYEDEVIAKGVAEAAFIYYDSKDNDEKINFCITADRLIDIGYISSEQGLLKKYKAEDIKEFSAKVDEIEGEKKVTIYKNSSNCSDESKIINYEEKGEENEG